MSRRSAVFRCPMDEVDAREARLRDGPLAAALPAAGTSEGRQLRRWLTQLIVTERVVAAEAAALGVTARNAPSEAELLPDTTARLEIGSIAAAALAEPSSARTVRPRHRRGRGQRRRRGRLPRPKPAAVRRDEPRPPRLAGPGRRRPAAASGARRDRRPPAGGRAAPSLPGVARRTPGRRWCGWHPDTSTPATRVNPTTPTGTEAPHAHPDPRHRRHQDRRRPRRPVRSAGACRHPAYAEGPRRRRGLGCESTG